MGQKVIAISIVLVLMFAVLLNVNGQNDEGIEPITPTPIIFPPPISYQPLLICPYFREIKSGYNWNGIIIGESTQQELEQLLNELGTYQIIYADEGTLSNSISYLREYLIGDTSSYPDSIDICLQDGIIVVMEINLSGNQELHIEDFVEAFGLPDVVTWSISVTERMVFWFEEGIAAEVFVYDSQNENDKSSGRFIRIFYFMPQNTIGYETRWPFVFTRQYPFNPSYPDDRYITEQNPFDFDSMIATMTIIPIFTPTASP